MTLNFDLETDLLLGIPMYLNINIEHGRILSIPQAETCQIIQKIIY
jgi:hypothetical protein